MGRRLSARLSDEACDGWEEFASANGVTVAALLEAIGQLLTTRRPAITEEWVQATVTLAREVQRKRRRRR